MPCLSPALLARRTGQHLDAWRSEPAELFARLTAWGDPNWPGSWYHLGLVYKRQARWHASQRANAAAARLHPGYEPAWWNLGIAATARDDWREARRAWTAYGIDVPEGDGPIEMNIGLTPICLNPDGRAEVVWTMRLDPARARILSVPFPASGHRYGDIVLHDGVPVGERVLRGEAVPVFNALGLLVTSAYGTYHADVRVTLHDDLADLEDVAERFGVRAQNWSASVRSLSREASEGRPPEELDTHRTEEVQLGIAARHEADITAFLDAWAAAREGRAVLDVHLGPKGVDTTA